MGNLGSSDTPVEGQSFTLPAGAGLDEDDGDLVITDSSGSVVFRRNESAGEWQFEGTDLTGISSLSTEEIQNNALPGDINYNDPLSKALHRGMTYRQNFESANGYNLRTQNSGSISVSRTGLILRTGSTASSYAGYQASAIYPRSFSAPGDRYTARIPTRIRDSGAEVFVVIGGLADPIASPQKNHVGFHFTDGALEASAGDGSTHTTEEITSSYSRNAVDTWVIDLDYRNKVRLAVYAAGAPENPKHTYTLSSGVPDTTNPDFTPQVYLNNESSSAGEYQVDVHKAPVMETRKA